MKKNLFLCLLLTSLVASAFGQEKKSNVNQLPSWVAMMNESSINYYRAVQSFKDFWGNRLKPEEDAAKGKETSKQLEERDAYRAMRLKMNVEQRAYDDLLNYHYKRFKNWMHEVKPYVQEDGSILSLEQRMAIFEQQKASIK